MVCASGFVDNITFLQIGRIMCIPKRQGDSINSCINTSGDEQVMGCAMYVIVRPQSTGEYTSIASVP